MDTLRTKVAYLKGLAEGLGVEKTGQEGRLVVEIISVLDDITLELSHLKEAQRDIEKYLDALDESVGELEDDYWGLEEDCIGSDVDNDDDFIEVECPSCHETVFFEADILEDDSMDQISCPQCGGVIFDFSDQSAENELDTVAAED